MLQLVIKIYEDLPVDNIEDGVFCPWNDALDGGNGDFLGEVVQIPH